MSVSSIAIIGIIRQYCIKNLYLSLAIDIDKQILDLPCASRECSAILLGSMP